MSQFKFYSPECDIASIITIFWWLPYQLQTCPVSIWCGVLHQLLRHQNDRCKVPCTACQKLNFPLIITFEINHSCFQIMYLFLACEKSLPSLLLARVASHKKDVCNLLPKFHTDNTNLSHLWSRELIGLIGNYALSP